MKPLKLLIAIFLATCSMANGQSITIQSSSNNAWHHRGGFWLDSTMVLPFRDTSALYPSVPKLGRVQLHKKDTALIYHNGYKWIRLPKPPFPQADVTGLLAALAAKEPSIASGTSLQYWRGDKTFQTLNTTVVPEGTNLYYTDSRVRSAISLTTTGTSGAASYSSATGVLNIPNYTSSATVSSVGISSTDLSVSGSPITTSGNITLNLIASGVGAGTYNGRYTVNTDGIITGATNQSVATETRSFGTAAFKPSTTNDCEVNYTVRISTTSTLGGTNGGQVFLEVSPDSTNWTLRDQAEQILTGLISTQVQVNSIRAFVPTGYFVRLRTATTGVNGATFTYITGWRKLY